MRLRKKTIILFLMSALVPLIAGSLASYLTARQALHVAVRADLDNVARGVMKDLENSINNIAGDLGAWSRLRVMQNVLIDDETGDIAEAIAELPTDNPELGLVMVTNGGGTVIASTRSSLLGASLRGSREFEVPRRGQLFFGDFGPSRFAAGNTLALAFPIRADFDPSTIIGVLLAILDWPAVQERLAQIPIMSAAQDNRHLLWLESQDGGVHLYVTADAPDLHAAEAAATHEGSKDAHETAIGSGRYLMSAAVPGGIDLVPDPHWIVYAAVSADVAYAAIERMRSTFLLIALVAAVAAIGLGWVNANSLTEPITAMISAMKRLAAGDKNATIPVMGRSDEIGEMATALRVFHQTKLDRDRSQEEKETLLRAAQAAEAASQAKSEFLANMSHELRTPLNAIIGFSEMMHDEHLGPIGNPRYAEYARDINTSGAHLLSIINDILDLSRAESGALALDEHPCRPAEIIDGALRIAGPAAEKNRLRVAVTAAEDLPSLFADERKLRQILINLLSNAIKFTPEGGRIDVGARLDGDGSFQFFVRDTGIGMSPAEVQVALTKFGQVDSVYTRKHAGTGLGLPLAKRFAEMHDGTLTIGSALGSGTTITVHLPAQRTLARHVDPEASNLATA